MSWLKNAEALTKALAEGEYEPPQPKPDEEPHINVAAITGML